MVTTVSAKRLQAMAFRYVKAYRGRRITLQGHNHRGWDTEDVRTQGDIKAYFRSQKKHGVGPIYLYLDGKAMYRTYDFKRDVPAPFGL